MQRPTTGQHADSRIVECSVPNKIAISCSISCKTDRSLWKGRMEGLKEPQVVDMYSESVFVVRKVSHELITVAPHIKSNQQNLSIDRKGFRNPTLI